MEQKLLSEKTVKKVITCILTIFIIAGGCLFTVLGAESDTISTEEERIATIERLLDQKYDLQINLQDMEQGIERDKLEREYAQLCNRLRELGVSNRITENIPLWDEESGVEPLIANPPDFSAYEAAFDLNTYYQYVTVDGVQYRLYNMVVSGKDKQNCKLSYGIASMVLKGKVTNEMEAYQVGLSTLKFLTSTAAGLYGTPAFGVAVSALTAVIPDFKPVYLIHSSDAIVAGPVAVNEFVQYVYAYDEQKDYWVHIYSRNWAKVQYDLSLFYYNKYLTYERVERVPITVIPDKGGFTQEQKVRHFLLMLSKPSIYKPIDSIYNTLIIQMDQGSDEKQELPLHATSAPGQLW